MLFQNLSDSQKQNLYRAFLATVVLLAVFLGVKVLSSLKELEYIGRGTSAANVIAVSGSGEVYAVPDVGSFSFSVVEEGKTVKEAQDKASKKVNSVIDAIKKMGIEEKDIKTTGYNSYPKYEYSQAQICTNGYCPPSRQTLIGYEVNQNITVKVRKTDQAGDVLTKVGSLEVSNISGLDFVIDDMDKVQSEARDKAVQDAKEKAKVLSRTLGVKLKRIVNYYESGNQPPIYYGMEAKAMGGTDMMPTVPEIPTGENKVVSNVVITYEIE